MVLPLRLGWISPWGYSGFEPCEQQCNDSKYLEARIRQRGKFGGQLWERRKAGDPGLSLDKEVESYRACLIGALLVLPPNWTPTGRSLPLDVPS